MSDTPATPSSPDPSGPADPVAPAGWGPPRSKTVTWWDPAATVAGAAGRSGLEFMQAVREGRVAPAPIAQLVGMRVERVERGLVVFSCTPDESVYNPIGAVHAGLMCTLLDSVCGCAVHTTLESGVGYTTVDITVNFVRAVTLASGTLTATGRVVKPGRRIALASAELHDSAGRLVTTATSNCLVIGPSTPPGP